MKILVFLLFGSVFCDNAWKAEEETSEFWKNVANEELNIALNQGLNKNVAKNVIIFLGDGMSIPTITAGRILKGQMEGKSGEESKLFMDKFQHAGLSRTYSVDKQVSDSASTATAYLCGVKSNYYTLGLTAASKIGNCSSSKGEEVNSVLVDAYEAGKATGVVTTTRINHATPAATYAHSASRKWYSDADLPDEAKENGCKDIAQQFYDSSHMITVAMGGGRKYFAPRTTTDPEYPKLRNNREDRQNLIEKWQMKQIQAGLNAEYVWNKEQFDKIDPKTTDKVLGLFQPGDMQFEVDRLRNDSAGEPSLAEMTEKAIKILQKNQEGFFLLVEGGRIDMGHHQGNAYLALHELVAFDEAISKGVALTSDEDTLIIVTADHSHTMSMGGYSIRGNNIFGLAPNDNDAQNALDRKPYTTLLYGNGPGWQGVRNTASILLEPNNLLTRKNITNIPTESRLYHQQSSVPLASETHGGDDVVILSRGPMSHLIHGVHQQNYIATVMRYAACLGSETGHCDDPPINFITNSTTGPDIPLVDPESFDYFIGIKLNVSQAVVGLYVQLAISVVLLFTAVCLACKKRQMRVTTKRYTMEQRL